MPPHAALSLAVALSYTLGAALALILFDGVVWLLLGNTATVSHGMYQLGRGRPWVPFVWLALTWGASLFLCWHFWWEPWPFGGGDR